MIAPDKKITTILLVLMSTAQTMHAVTIKQYAWTAAKGALGIYAALGSAGILLLTNQECVRLSYMKPEQTRCCLHALVHLARERSWLGLAATLPVLIRGIVLTAATTTLAIWALRSCWLDIKKIVAEQSSSGCEQEENSTQEQASE
jgi:hypothetical protein